MFELVPISSVLENTSILIIPTGLILSIFYLYKRRHRLP